MPPPQQEAREGASGSVPTHITPPHKSPAIPLLIYLLAKSYLESKVSAGCFCAQSSPDTATRVPAKHLARIFPIPALFQAMYCPSRSSLQCHSAFLCSFMDGYFTVCVETVKQALSVQGNEVLKPPEGPGLVAMRWA